MLGKCPKQQQHSRKQPDGFRSCRIIEISIQYGDSWHVSLQELLNMNAHMQLYYHKHCLPTYLLCAPSNSKSVCLEDCSCKRIKRLHIFTFSLRKHFLCCGKNCEIKKHYRHQNPWVQACLAKEREINEVDEKGNALTIRERVLMQCKT